MRPNPGARNGKKVDILANCNYIKRIWFKNIRAHQDDVRNTGIEKGEFA